MPDRIQKFNETYVEVEVLLEFYQESTEHRLHAYPQVAVYLPAVFSLYIGSLRVISALYTVDNA